MDKQLSVLFVLSCLCWFNAGAQSKDFRVLATAGGNAKTTSPAGVSRELSSGDILSLNDQVVLQNDGYVGMVYKNGQTFELTRAGTYSLLYIYNQMNGQNNLATKYLNFLWDKTYNSLVESKSDPKITGSLDIHPIGVNSGKLQILAVDPQKLNPVYGDKVVMKWIGGPEKPNTRYVVNVMNLYDQVLISEKVSQPEFSFSLLDPVLQNDGIISSTKVISFIVFVEGDENTRSWRYGLSTLRGKTAESVDSEVQFFKDVLSSESALDKLIFATYFEEKNLYIDAMTTYKSIIQEHPDVEDFKLLQNAFILRSLPKTSARGL